MPAIVLFNSIVLNYGCSLDGRNDHVKAHWFYILLSLSERERHGSEIMRDVLALTEGELTLWPATLYGSLEELSEREWIEELPAGERPSEASDRQRIYRLTSGGRAAVREEAHRLAGLVEVARTRLAGER